MTDTKPKCDLCNHHHNPDEEHIWFQQDGASDFQLVTGDVEIEPEPTKKIETTKTEPRGPKLTPNERAMAYRRKNPEKYREYMRNYMAKRRSREE